MVFSADLHAALRPLMISKAQSCIEMLLAASLRLGAEKGRRATQIVALHLFHAFADAMPDLQRLACEISQLSVCTISSTDFDGLSSVCGVACIERPTLSSTPPELDTTVEFCPNEWGDRCLQPGLVLDSNVAFAGSNEAFVSVQQPLDGLAEYMLIAPRVLDALLKLCGVAATGVWNDTKSIVVGVDRLQFYNSAPSVPGWMHAKMVRQQGRCILIDAAIFSLDGEPILVLEGVQMLNHQALPPVPTLSPECLRQCATEVGIMAFEYYCPDLCVRAADIEAFHGVSGQYTTGRGQENVTFCSDDEDAVSMAMSAFHRLMERCELDCDEIGRLEVGTESQVDRAKSIKTFLMAFFEEQGIHDVEGADTYNACYGGTNALFNAVNWVQSEAWNGKYAVVICSDTAVHPDSDHLSVIGASAVAMLVGPRAAMVVEPQRVSFMKHAWDFYRPIGWHNNDALVDMSTATVQFEEALTSCQERFSAEHGTQDLMAAHYDFAAFHCNAPYHAKRSFRIMSDAMHGRKLARNEHDELYKLHVEAGTAISAQNVSPLHLDLIDGVSFCLS